MSQGKVPAQIPEQVGSPDKAGAVGLEVGGVHSSPLGRRDAACSRAMLRDEGAGNGSQEIITPRRFGRLNARSTARPRRQPNALRRSDSESRIREIRPSGLMSGRDRQSRTNKCGWFNLVHPVPAYSTPEFRSGSLRLRQEEWHWSASGGSGAAMQTETQPARPVHQQSGWTAEEVCPITCQWLSTF